MVSPNAVGMAADPFDATDPASVLAHARKLKGLTIGQIAERMERPDLIARTGKGRAGSLIELWFGIENDTESAPDLRATRFPESAYQGLEIKVVPLKRKSQGGYGVKERNVVSMISYPTLPAETWQDAKLRHKLEHMLFVFYIHEDGDSWMRGRVVDAHLWTLSDALDSERKTIQDDWSIIQRKVAMGDAHDLHESDTTILKACRKGPGGAERPSVYRSDAPPAFRRAYSLARGHMEVVWTRDVQGHPIVEVAKPGEDFERIVLAKLRGIEGKRLREIDPNASWKGKATASQVIRAVLGATPDKIKEFLEHEVTVRVTPFYEDNGSPKEAVSFPTMSLREFVDEDWDQATIRDYISCILFVPVLLPTRDTDAPDYVVGRAFFWRPSSVELAGIEAEWRMYQRQVREGACRVVMDIKGRRASGLPKASETRYIHMRPHGRDGDDTDADNFGNRIVRQSFWLNQSFIRRLYLAADRLGRSCPSGLSSRS